MHYCDLFAYHRLRGCNNAIGTDDYARRCFSRRRVNHIKIRTRIIVVQTFGWCNKFTIFYLFFFNFAVVFARYTRARRTVRGAIESSVLNVGAVNLPGPICQFIPMWITYVRHFNFKRYYSYLLSLSLSITIDD